MGQEYLDAIEGLREIMNAHWFIASLTYDHHDMLQCRLFEYHALAMRDAQQPMKAIMWIEEYLRRAGIPFEFKRPAVEIKKGNKGKQRDDHERDVQSFDD